MANVTMFFVYFKSGENGYSADVVVGTNINNISILYDLVNISYKKITEATDTIQGNSQVSRREASVKNDATTLSSESQEFSEKREQSNLSAYELSEFVSMSDELLEQKRIAEANANELNNLTEFPARKLNRNDISSVVKDLCNTAKAHR